jgi:hypothetical protein
MSLSNATESDVLDFILKGVDPSWRSGATGYWALSSLASPDEAAPIAAELTYTGYARVSATKSTAFSGSGATRNNAAQIQFGKRTDGGATQYGRSLIWCDTASGAVNMAFIAPLNDELAISLNIQPTIAIGDATFTAE